MRHCVYQFSAKLDNFDFFGPNLPKKEIRIWNSGNSCWNKNQHPWDTMCTNFQTKWTTLSFWPQICWKMDFGGRNFRNLSLNSESASLRYYVHQFSNKTDNFYFLGPNLPKNGFWDRSFKNLGLDSESAPPKYHVC